MKSRAYSNMDYEKVIEFLNEVYKINQNQHSWLPARWEYTEYFVNPLEVILGNKNWLSSIRLWIDDDFNIVGIASSENPNHKAFIQIHPNYRHLEEEMINWAEDNIALEQSAGEGKKISIYCHDGDTYRESILEAKGYMKSEKFEFLKWQSLEKEIMKPKLPKDYSLHTFGEDSRIEQKIVCITRAFNPTYECREEDLDPDDFLLFRNLCKAPMYRKDLDIYIKHSDGTITASALVWFDPRTKTGVFEPVATHPGHQGKGIGKSVVIEGLRRLKQLGAKVAYVGTHGENQNKFYESVGFIEYDRYREWTKLI